MRRRFDYTFVRSAVGRGDCHFEMRTLPGEDGIGWFALADAAFRSSAPPGETADPLVGASPVARFSATLSLVPVA
jgi:hypothetical protein